MTAAAGAAAAASSVESIFLLDLDFFFFFHFTLHHINSFSLFELARSCVRSLRLFLFSALFLFRSLSLSLESLLYCLHVCVWRMHSGHIGIFMALVCMYACLRVCVCILHIRSSLNRIFRSLVLLQRYPLHESPLYLELAICEGERIFFFQNCHFTTTTTATATTAQQ